METESYLEMLMANRGGLIIFGPGHREATLKLFDPNNVKAVFSFKTIDDVVVPDTIFINCSMIFCHSLTWVRGRKVTTSDLEKWSSKLMEGIVFKPASVPGLSQDEIEPAKLQFSADEKTNDLLFLIQWGFVKSTHCVDVARSLERNYARIS
jgi:hypothetical protein